MTYVLPLSRIGSADAGRVGHKAATLGELTRAGFAVPAGFAVVATASTAAAERAPGLAADVGRALDALGGGPVAVRSSGVEEDLPGMSYAGQYESVLDVRGLDAVLDALRTCWASGSAARVAAYRRGTGEPARLGVLVQTMVPADVAGVVFSSNPVTGDRTETVVNAVRGLGDRLMAGEVTAGEWTVRDGVIVRSTADTVDGEMIRAVAQVAGQVAAYLGAPQDIEWAVADGQIWLLQARPITALPAPPVAPVPIEIRPPAGFSARHRGADRPWVPMQTSVFLPIFSDSCRHVFGYTTGVTPTAHLVGGWAYVTTPPDDVDMFAARLERIAVALADGEPQALIQRWNNEWKPSFAQRIVRARGVDLPGLPDATLDAHVRELVTFFGDLHDRYFRLTGAAIALVAELGAACADLLGWSPEQALRLRPGLRGDHMRAVTELGALARLAADRPAVRRLLAGPAEAADPADSADPAARLSDVDPVFARAFADYVAGFGHRTVGFDLTQPTLAEQPDVLLSLIRAQLDQPYDFAAERTALARRRSAALAEARRALRDRPPADRARFEAAVGGSSLSSAVRDEKVFYAVSLWALLRYAVRELGRRLANRGVIDRVDDVFFLQLAEALAALAARPGEADHRDPVRQRRGQYAWALANPGPPGYGPPPPPLGGQAAAAASPAAQRVWRTAQWSMSLIGAATTTQPGDGALSGVAASPGRYVGPVRVITDVAGFGKLRRGDVLVCPETTAQWAILFPSVGALVTDKGSLLAHPAIIAREYGVPAVVATGSATSTLRDGQLVIVDGDAGRVREVREIHQPVAETAEAIA